MVKITKHALRVNAILIALKDDENADVIDTICIFIKPIIEKWRNNPVTASLLAKGLRIVYGWNITEAVAETFLARLESKGEVTRNERHALIATPSSSEDDNEETVVDYMNQPCLSG